MCGESIHWLALWLSLLSTCSWCVVSAYTWLALWLSLLSTCSWCVVSAYTWLALWLSLLSPVAGVWWAHWKPCPVASRCIQPFVPVDAAHREHPPPPHTTTTIVKSFGCTTIHNKRYINASFIHYCNPSSALESHVKSLLNTYLICIRKDIFVLHFILCSTVKTKIICLYYSFGK